MKKYKLIMSDLDNTLLPLITQERFVEIWFRDVAKKFSSHGMDPALAVSGVNEGVRAILFNDSGRRNVEVFYETAEKISGYPREKIEIACLDYYTSTFVNVREIARENPYAVRIAERMNEKADFAVIATMPVFTFEAVASRMGWVGLSPSMFDLVTTMDESSYSKPDPRYFKEILDRFGVMPDEALMIGNDVREDMRPCRELGVDTFLVTDYMITHGLPYDEFRRGTYPELVAFLESLP